MIKTFHDAVTEKIFNGSTMRKVNETLFKKTRRRLEFINVATSIDDLYFPPSNRLHKLKGFKPDRYSISVDMQWRITFEWRDGNAYDVFFEDYHR
ncbi:MAG: type II toxin-antitoxin system RelE/ParE family toxin [Deltaproteobacteria bacterium]|nr:type II toxin-antitoxin system RelE/ParE family toxin [Deltaproteobacteria bacterium]